MHLTGPHVDEVPALSGRSELVQWLDEAHASRTRVILVSLGPDVIWQPWYADMICKGIRDLAQTLQIKAVIEMPNSYQEYTAKKPEIFFAAEQLPHAEILTHPAIAIGLSAADFNSTMSCIAQGVPMLCFPHYGN